MRDFFTWMNETPWSIALRESFFVWPILEATHVLTIMLFVGTIVMVDLRLLNLAFKNVPAQDMTARVLPWTVAGFAIMIVTGLLLFYAKPLVYYHSIFFRIKVLVLLLAMGNILYFHKRIQNSLTGEAEAVIPRAAKVSAALSLTAWISVVVAGRLIAYDWYNCEKLDADGLMSFLADCPAPIVAEQPDDIMLAGEAK